jgi:hypothetical protein
MSKLVKIVTSGTGIERASKSLINQHIDDVISVSYTEMLLCKKGESKYFLEEYLDELDPVKNKLEIEYLKNAIKEKELHKSSLEYAPDVNFFKLVLPSKHRIKIEENNDKNDLTGWSKLLSDVKKNINIINPIIKGLWGRSGDILLDTLAISNAIDNEPKVVQFFVGSPTNKEMNLLAEQFEKILKNHIIRVLSGENDATNKEAEKLVKNDIKRCREENKDGVVVISKNMGSRSFSIPETDAVVLMFDNGSTSALVQKISRALTGGKNYHDEEKKEGNIISLSLDPNRIDPVDLFIIEESQKNKTKQESIPAVIKRIRRSVNIFSIDDNGDKESLLISDEYYSELLDKFNFDKLKNSQIDLIPLISDEEFRNLLSGTKNVTNLKAQAKDKQLSSKGKKFLDDGEKEKNNVEKNDDEKIDIETLRQCIITINNSILSISGIDDSVFSKKSFRSTLLSISKDNEKLSEFLDLLGIETTTVIELLNRGVINENLIDFCLSRY